MDIHYSIKKPEGKRISHPSWISPLLPPAPLTAAERGRMGGHARAAALDAAALAEIGRIGAAARWRR